MPRQHIIHPGPKTDKGYAWLTKTPGKADLVDFTDTPEVIFTSTDNSTIQAYHGTLNPTIHYTPEQIASVCHEANRQLQLIQAAPGIPVATPWEEFTEKAGVISGVQFMLDNPYANPIDLHNNWLRDKQAQGWSYGPEKDTDLKQHPCFRPYHELPHEQRVKDAIFKAIVVALSSTPSIV
jgi:hypothetical protein